MIEHLFSHRRWNVRVVKHETYAACFISEHDEAPVYMSCHDPMQARRQAIAYINKVTAHDYLGRHARQKIVCITTRVYEGGISERSIGQESEGPVED